MKKFLVFSFLVLPLFAFAQLGNLNLFDGQIFGHNIPIVSDFLGSAEEAQTTIVADYSTNPVAGTATVYLMYQPADNLVDLGDGKLFGLSIPFIGGNNSNSSSLSNVREFSYILTNSSGEVVEEGKLKDMAKWKAGDIVTVEFKNLDADETYQFMARFIYDNGKTVENGFASTEIKFESVGGEGGIFKGLLTK